MHINNGEFVFITLDGSSWANSLNLRRFLVRTFLTTGYVFWQMLLSQLIEEFDRCETPKHLRENFQQCWAMTRHLWFSIRQSPNTWQIVASIANIPSTIYGSDWTVKKSYFDTLGKPRQQSYLNDNNFFK